jgi:hypothetical protein
VDFTEIETIWTSAKGADVSQLKHDRIAAYDELIAILNELGPQEHKDLLTLQTLLELQELLEEKKVDEVMLRSQVDELARMRDEHLRTIEQTRSALHAASARVEELDTRYKQAQERAAREALVKEKKLERMSASLKQVEFAARLEDTIHDPRTKELIYGLQESDAQCLVDSLDKVGHPPAM